MSESYIRYRQERNREIGLLPPQDEGVFKETLKAVGNTVLDLGRSYGSTLEETTGISGMREYFDDVKRTHRHWEGDPSYRPSSLKPSHVARTIATGVTQSAAAIGAGALGTLAAGPVGGAAAMTGVTFAQLYGDTVKDYREAMEGESDELVKGMAFLSAAGQSAIETVLGPERVLAGIGKGFFSGALKQTTRSLAKRIGANAARGAIEEGSEEVCQLYWDTICKGVYAKKGIELPGWEEVKDNFMGGALPGAVLSGVAGGAGKYEIGNMKYEMGAEPGANAAVNGQEVQTGTGTAIPQEMPTPATEAVQPEQQMKTEDRPLFDGRESVSMDEIENVPETAQVPVQMNGKDMVRFERYLNDRLKAGTLIATENDIRGIKKFYESFPLGKQITNRFGEEIIFAPMDAGKVDDYIQHFAVKRGGKVEKFSNKHIDLFRSLEEALKNPDERILTETKNGDRRICFVKRMNENGNHFVVTAISENGHLLAWTHMQPSNQYIETQRKNEKECFNKYGVVDRDGNRLEMTYDEYLQKKTDMPLYLATAQTNRESLSQMTIPDGNNTLQPEAGKSRAGTEKIAENIPGRSLQADETGRKLAGAMAKALKLNLTLEQRREGDSGDVRGWYDSKDNSLHVYADTPVLEVFGHELKHYFDHKWIGTELSEFMLSNLNDAGRTELQKITDRYHQQGVEANAAEELLADQFGRMLSDPEFLSDTVRRAEAKRAGFGKRIAQLVLDYVKQMRKKLKLIGTKEAQEWFDHLGEIRDRAAELIAGIAGDSKYEIGNMKYEMEAERRADAAVNGQETRTRAVDGSMHVQRVKTGEIAADPARFQFKGDVNAEGVAQDKALGGQWDDKSAGVLYLWEDKNGRKFVVNGHHRLALANRLNVPEVNAIVDREADGVTAEQARHNGALQNIRQGQGTVLDYANFIRQEGMSEKEAGKEGLLSREEGRTGYLIGHYASDNLLDFFRNGDITAAKAAAIASAAHGDANLERVGLHLQKGMSADALMQTLKLAQNELKNNAVQADDLFGDSGDSALREWEELGKRAQKKQDEIARDIKAIQNAVRNPETAKKGGVDVREKAKKNLERLKQEQQRWKNWHTDTELMNQLKEETAPKAAEKAEEKTGEPEVMSLDQFLASHGVAAPISDFMIDKLKIPHGLTARQEQQFHKEAEAARNAYHNKRDAAIEEYERLVAEGKIRKPTIIEEALRKAHGHPDNPSVQVARRALKKRGIDWRTGKPLAESVVKQNLTTDEGEAEQGLKFSLKREPLNVEDFRQMEAHERPGKVEFDTVKDLYHIYEQEYLGQTIRAVSGHNLTFKPGHFFRLIAEKPEGMRKGWITKAKDAADAIAKIKAGEIDFSDIAGYQKFRAENINLFRDVVTDADFWYEENGKITYGKKYAGIKKADGFISVTLDLGNNELGILSFHPHRFTQSFLEGKKIHWHTAQPIERAVAPDDVSSMAKSPESGHTVIENPENSSAESQKNGKFPENEGVKYSLAWTEQRNPIEVEGETQRENQEKLDQEVHEVHHDADVLAEAKAEIDAHGGIGKVIEKVLNGRKLFTPDDVGQRMGQLVMNSDEYGKLSAAERSMVSDAVIQVGTQLGQALRSRRSLTEAMMSDPDALKSTLRLITDRTPDADKTREHVKEKTGVDPLAPPDDLVNDKDKLDQVLRELSAGGANLQDKIYEYWINAILSGPQTHAVNVIGNTANVAYELTAKRFAEACINLIAKKKGSATFGEFREMWKHLSFSEAWNRAVFAFNHEMISFNGKYQENSGPAISGKTGRLVRLPSRLLNAADQFSRTLIQPVETAAMAYREGVSRGLGGKALQDFIERQIQNPKSNAFKYGKERAQEMVFQEAPGAIVRYLIAMKNEPGIKGTLIRFLFPFIKTPSNILRQGLRKSPLGALSLAGETLDVLRGKRGIDNRYIQHAAEQILAWSAFLMLKGFDSGDDEDDLPILTGSSATPGSGEALFKGQHLPAYSIRIGGTWYSYKRIEPLATGLTIIADAMQELREVGRGKSATAALKKMLKGTTSMIMEKSYLDTLNQVNQLMSDPEREVANWSTNFLSSWMPAAVRQTVTAMDDTVRDFKMRSLGADWYNDFFHTVTSRAGLTKRAPKIDYYGREIRKEFAEESTAGDVVFRLLSGSGRKPAWDLEAEDQIIANWNLRHPDAAWWPNIPNWKFRMNKQDYYFDTETYPEYARKAGELARKQVRRAIRNGYLNVENPREKDIELMKKILMRARKETRQKMFSRAREIR